MLDGRKVWIVHDNQDGVESCEIVRSLRNGNLKLKRKGLSTFEFDSMGRIPDFKYGDQVYGYLRGTIKGERQVQGVRIKLQPIDDQIK